MTKQLLLISVAGNCKSNSILSSRLIRYFRANDYEVTNDSMKADVIVINTCGFLKDKVLSSRNIIGRVLKKRNTSSRVISVGCLNRIDRSVLEAMAPDLMLIDDLSRLDTLLSAKVPYLSLKSSYFDKSLFDNVRWDYSKLLTFIKKIYFKTTYTFSSSKDHQTVCRERLKKVYQEDKFENKLYVEIGTGCLSNCSYCVIKKARGDVRSRSIREILGDIKANYKSGQVLNLVADDCGSYGIDIGGNIFGLIDAINGEFPDVPIDICYLNPVWLEKHPGEYLDMFRKSRIYSVNISMQSGSDRIIKLMNRNYKVDSVLGIIEKIRLISPRTLLWSHFIIDHPSETWQDFWLTLKAAKSFHFFHHFNYSPLDRDRVKNGGLGGGVRKALKISMMLFLCYRLCRKP